RDRPVTRRTRMGAAPMPPIEGIASRPRPEAPMLRLRIVLTTGVTTLLLGPGNMAAQSASAATHTAPRPAGGQNMVITVHMHPVKIRDGKIITNGTGQTVGNCGLAQLILHAGASTYLLTLFSSAGGMGVGTYSVS